MLAVVCRSHPEPTQTFHRRSAAALARRMPLVRVALRRSRHAVAGAADGTVFVREEGGRGGKGFITSPLRALGMLARLVWGSRVGDKEGGLPGAFAAWWDGLALASWARAHGVDAFHSQFAGWDASAAWTAARILRVPFSFEVHNPYGFVVGRSLLRAKLRAARVVAAISEDARDRVAALEPRASVRVVRCGVDGDDVARGARAGARRGAYDVVAVGSLVPRKGHAVFVDALARLTKQRPQVRAAIVGEGPLAKSLCGRAKELGAPVEFLGGLSEDDTLSVVASARVLALACVVAEDGDEDGIPVALMEAMSLGTPVVSTPVGGIAELLEDGRAGELVPAGDAASLAVAIGRVLDDSPIRAARVAAGRRAVAARHDLASCAAGLALALGAHRVVGSTR